LKQFTIAIVIDPLIRTMWACESDSNWDVFERRFSWWL